MHCYSLTLQQPSAITCAIYGNFSAPKAQEIVVARGSVLQLLRPEEATGRLLTICTTQTFSVIRSLQSFRLAGSKTDNVVVGNDSGKISILSFSEEKNCFDVIHCEVFGKTGCRRIIPGQYLAVDPKGRAIMIAAIEKQKLVYVMNRDASNQLTISSPLEAHKSQIIVFSVCGVDVDFDNPTFAAIEIDYSDADQDPTGEAAVETEKHLTYYELELGLNHVTRKWSEPISRTANLLFPVPGGDDGPSGVLICGDNWVAYKHINHPEVRTPLPRRDTLPPERGVLITCGAMHKQKNLFFYVLQSEYGDLYKASLQLSSSGEEVTDVIITVLDTVPVATAMCITKHGLLFLASEFSNHYVFEFQGLGDDEDAVRASSVNDPDLGDDSKSAATVAPVFKPGKLKNLVMVDEIESLSPITDILVADLANEQSNQIYTLCGRGNRSSLRVLRHGLAMSEMAVSTLPGTLTGVWTVKEHQDQQFDKYIIVSFTNATLVLSIGDTIEEIQDSGFQSTSPTLAACLLDDNALVQVYVNGIRHIRPGKRINEWKAPGKQLIEKAAVNSRQVIIYLTDGELIYFELDSSGILTDISTKNFGIKVSCLDLGEVPEGRTRSSFVAVGAFDNTVRLLSLDPSDLLAQRSMLQVPERAESVCLAEMASDANQTSSFSLYLNVGLANGVMQRLSVDTNLGSLSGVRSRFLGATPVKLFRVKIQGKTGVLALSSRPWLSYNFQSQYYMTPLSYEYLEAGTSFASEQCSEGFVAVTGNTLRIISVNQLGTMFNQQAISLSHTPRKMIQVPNTNHLLIIESDHNEYNSSESAEILQNNEEKMDITKKMDGNLNNSEKTEEDELEETKELPIRGPIPPTDGKWASCIRHLNPATGETLEVLELSENESAFSITTCVFQSRGPEAFVIVGTAQSLRLHPRQQSGCFIHVYRLLENKLLLVHKTEVEDIPLAMIDFQGRLLVGIGRCLRLYDLGKKKLLKKCENRLFSSCITRIHTMGDRIYVGDMMESIHYVKYKRSDNSLVIFADDETPRMIVSSTILDYDTVAGSDKFGNIFVLRLPPDVSDDVDNPTGNRILWDTGYLNGAPDKIKQIVHFYVGEVVTSIIKASLTIGGAEVILFATVLGRIGVLLPFGTREDVDFFKSLEMFMRQEMKSLCGRDQLSYRSYFIPVREVIDGDLCEQVSLLPHSKLKQISEELDRSPAEILKKLEDTRNKLL